MKKCIECGLVFQKESAITFHKLPTDQNLLAKWLHFVKQGDGRTFGVNSYLCSLHFDQNMLKRNQQRVTLVPNAIPTIKFPQTENPGKLLKGEVRVLSVIEPSSSTSAIHEVVLSDSDYVQKSNLIRKQEQRIATLLSQIDTQNEKIRKLQMKTTRQQFMMNSMTMGNKSFQNKLRQLSMENSKLKVENNRLKTEAKSKEVDLDLIEQNCGPIFLQILRFGVQKRHFNIDTKKFCATLFAYSKKAYLYLRKIFKNILPTSKTIHRYLALFDIKPGFLTQCLKKIEELVAASVEPIFCSVGIDEVHTRDQIQLNSKNEYEGYIDLSELDMADNNKKIATSALFVVAVALNKKWKIPIAYFLTNGLTTEIAKKVIEKALIRLRKTGVRPISFVFDGLQSNISAAECLGAKLQDVDHMQTYIFHPETQEKVYFLLDPPHMLKLLRNLWKGKTADGVLVNQDGKLLKWEVIEKLVRIQKEQGLRAANSVTDICVNFENQKMKVYPAAKLFSSSAATALRFLVDINMMRGEDALPVADFLDTVDCAFDAMNVTNPFGKGRKAPLTLENRIYWSKAFENMKTCLLGLRLNNKKQTLLIKSRVKTGPLGFLASMKSIESIFGELCDGENPPLKYLLTYKLNQDHEELMFACIRSSGGFNNNPNCVQLKGAIKHILAGQIEPGDNANCKVKDLTHIPTFQQSTLERTKLQNSIPFEVELGLEDFDYNKQTLFIMCVTAYIGGSIISSLKIDCERCRNAVTDRNGKDKQEFLLIKLKDNGALVYPSPDIFKLLKITQKLVEIYRGRVSLAPKIPTSTVIDKILEICEDENILSQLHSEEEELKEHTNHLIRLIVTNYVQERAYHDVKQFNMSRKPYSIRSRNNRNTIFQGM